MTLSTFAMRRPRIDIDEIPEAPRTIIAPPPAKRFIEIDMPEPWPSPPVLAKVESPEDAEARRKARVEADHEAAKAMGFDTTDTDKLNFRAGQAVNAIGVDNAQRFLDAHAKMPTVGESFAKLHNEIAAERRTDIIVTLADLTLIDGDTIGTPDGAAYPIEGVGDYADMGSPAGAWAGFTGRMDQSGGWLLNRGSEIRTAAFNTAHEENLTRWADEDKAAHDQALADYETAYQAASTKAYLAGKRTPRYCPPEAPGPRQAQLRTRTLPGQSAPTVYAVTGKDYAELDADAVMGSVQSVLGNDAKCVYTYDAPRARWNVQVHFATNVKASDFACGEYFSLVLDIFGDDTGKGRLEAMAKALRNLCLNLIVIGKATKKLASVIHRGNIERQLERFASGFAEGTSELAPFLSRWGYASAREVSLTAGSASVLANRKGLDMDYEKLERRQKLAALYGGLAATDAAPITRMMIPGIVDAYGRDLATGEGAITVAGLANGLTRYAHEDNADRWTGDALERAAGALVWSTAPVPVAYQYVSALG